MYIVLGATGHIGTKLVKILVNRGESVIGVTSNPDHKSKIEAAGAEAAVADVQDSDQLAKIFAQGTRLYILNPPASISKDTVKEEQKSIDSILAAVEASRLEKVVAESTYGAQPGPQLGDLGVLYNMEQELKKLHIPSEIIRGSYYMTNWDMSLSTAKSEGKVYSLYPADFKFPMVHPEDISHFAAKLLTDPVKDVQNNEVHYFTGPRDYSSKDVALAFATALNKIVEAVEVKQADWMNFLMKVGFSNAAAESMVNMTKISLEQGYEQAQTPHRGTTTLQDHIKAIVKKDASSSITS